jgi:hypothetical protein
MVFEKGFEGGDFSIDGFRTDIILFKARKPTPDKGRFYLVNGQISKLIGQKPVKAL